MVVIRPFGVLLLDNIDGCFRLFGVETEEIVFRIFSI